MNIRDFINEYHFIYKNCIDSQTSQIINLDKLKEVVTYLKEKYTLFDIRKFLIFLIACSDGSKNGINEDLDFMELSFLKQDDVNFFRNTYISTFLQHDDLKKVNNDFQTINRNLDLIELLLEKNDEKIQKLEKQVLRNEKRLSFNPKSNTAQLETLRKFLIPKYINSEYENIVECIFSDRNVKIEHPVEWKMSNKLLTYLFEQLISASIINNTEYSNVIEKMSLFKNRFGKLIKAGDLQTAKSVYLAEDKNPIGYEDIDKLIISLNKLKP